MSYILFSHDQKLTSRVTNTPTTRTTPKTTQQFRVSLQLSVNICVCPILSNVSLSLKKHDDAIPRVVRSCVAFLDNESVLQNEGLLRRSANVQNVKEVQIASITALRLSSKLTADSSIHLTHC